MSVAVEQLRPPVFHEGFCGSAGLHRQLPPPCSSERVEQILRHLFNLYSVDTARFHELYSESTDAAVRLIPGVDFRGYAVRQQGDPSALHYAAGCGCLEACARLLEVCGRLNFGTDVSSRTPLCWAAERGLCSTVKLLLLYGANPLHTTTEGLSPLHLAAAGGFPRMCSILLDQSGVREHSTEKRTQGGLTPLHLAARHGHAEVCRCLLEDAPEQAASLTLHRRTPLHLAAMKGHLAATKRILEAMPEVLDFEDIDGIRAVDFAREFGFLDVAVFLVKEMESQDALRAKWQQRFEPCYRALLNSSACDAYLEIGRARVHQVEFKTLTVVAHCVDVLGIIASYTVEVAASDNSDLTTSSFHFSRCEDQAPIDDVEFRIARRRDGATLWAPGTLCRFRITGSVDKTAAADVGVACSSVSSMWSIAKRIPG